MMRRSILTLFAATLLACLALAPSALADVTADHYVETSNAKLGAHGDLTLGADFDFGVSTSETLKRVVYDLPTGMTIDPAAIPFASRCPLATFNSGVCDASSTIGTVSVNANLYLPPPLGSGGLGPLPGTLSLIQTTPALPMTVGVLLADAGSGIAIRAKETISLVDGGSDPDFYRVVTDPLPNQYSQPPFTATVQITHFEQELSGQIGGSSFVTNPTTGSSWNAFGYAQAYTTNSNANADPLAEGGGNHFLKSSALTIAADTVPSPPTIDSGPSGTAAPSASSFTFSSPESGVTFETKVDGGAFAAATSPASFSGLADGSHTFTVRAKNSLGTTSTSATRTWTVQTPAPPAPPASTPPAQVDYSVSVTDVKKCLKKPTLQVSPTIASASQVASIAILVNKKLVKTLTGASISTKLALPKKLKLKKGKSYAFEVQVQFKPDAANPCGKLVTQAAKFKLCK